MAILKGKKVAWIDVETGGFSALKNPLLQFACIITVDAKEVDRENFFMCGLPDQEISDGALKATGFDRETIKTWESPIIQQPKIIAMFDRNCDKFNKSDKMAFGGYNAPFDNKFFWTWMKEIMKYNFLGAYFNGKMIDPMNLMHIGDNEGLWSLPDYQLGTVAGYFEIPIKAHDALSDIEATIAVYNAALAHIRMFKGKNA